MHNIRAAASRATAGLTKKTIQALTAVATAFTPPLVVLGLLLGLATSLVFVLKPLTWLPPAGESHILLGILLTAQATIAAFTLAVTLFVMQGLHNRNDIDDRGYREYINRSRVKWILWSSLLAVGVTGAVLLAEQFIGASEDALSTAPGLSNLTMLAIAAFISNLILPGAMFARAIHLARPQQWIDLRRSVNEQDVRSALRAFFERSARAVDSLLANEPDITAVFPDLGEGSADEAIRGLLDEARKAMRERRLAEFTRTIEAIENLITYALDEMQKLGLTWGSPGSQPEWPPLRELSRNLYSFREDVIREGTREYLLELYRLDYWLVSAGMERRCGEMFSSGLIGYRHNYQIANRYGEPELREAIRERFGLAVIPLIYRLDGEELFPYVQEIVNLQEVMLSVAMHLNQADDYERLHGIFRPVIQTLEWHWQVDSRPESSEPQLHQHLQQKYRIGLMGLAGRAALIDQTGRINNADAYLNIARDQYPSTEQLAYDIAQAITPHGPLQTQLWSEWEMEALPPGEMGYIQAEQYPLAFFSIRLMELLTTQGGTLNLHGRANQVLGWFSSNSERVQHLVNIDPETTLEERREFAVEALRLAVRVDEAAEDYNIINRQLSPERVSAFIEGVRSTATQNNVVEQVFQSSGAFRSLPSGTIGCPAERASNRLVPKGYFAEDSSAGQYYYHPTEGDGVGRSLAYNTMVMLCTALDEEAQHFATPLDTPEAMMQAIDEVIVELDVSTELLLLAAGDWVEIEMALRMEPPEGYIAQWQLQEPAMAWKIGRYRNHLIVQGPRNGDRRLYIVDPVTWGLLVRGQFKDGEDIRAEFTPVSDERARTLLSENPHYFPGESDQESKLLKLQTTVQIEVGVQEEFQVKDPARARRITDATVKELQTSAYE